MPHFTVFAGGGSMSAVLTVGLAVAIALDLAGCVVAVSGTRTARGGLIRARAQMALGMLVVGAGQAAWATAHWPPAVNLLPAAPDWAMLTWGAALVGLLLLGSGAERLVSASPATRRGARLVEAMALACVLLGAAEVVLAAMSGGAGAGDLAPRVLGPLGDFSLLGRTVALAGASAVVVANASGRESGPVPHRRRIGLMMAAAAFATVCAVEPVVASLLTGRGVDATIAATVGPVAAALAFMPLAMAVRALFLPVSDQARAAARAWRSASQKAARARRPARPRPEPRVRAAVSPRVSPRLLTLAPITLPILGRFTYLSVPPAPRPFALAEVDRALATGRAAGEVERPAASMAATSGLGQPAIAAASASESASESASTSVSATVTADVMAAVVEMQLALARKGHRHSIDELLGVFEDVNTPVADATTAPALSGAEPLALAVAAAGSADAGAAPVFFASASAAGGVEAGPRLAAAPHLSPAIVPGADGALRADSGGVLHLLPRPHLLP